MTKAADGRSYLYTAPNGEAFKSVSALQAQYGDIQPQRLDRGSGEVLGPARKRPAAAAAAAADAAAAARAVAARPSTSSSSSSSAAAPSAAAAAALSGEHPQFELSQCEAAEASLHTDLENPEEIAPAWCEAAAAAAEAAEAQHADGSGGGAAMELASLRQRLHAAARDFMSEAERADLCAAARGGGVGGGTGSVDEALRALDFSDLARRAMCSGGSEIAALPRRLTPLLRTWAPRAALAVAAGGAWTAEGGPMVTEASGADGLGGFDLLGVARPPWRRPEDILPPPAAAAPAAAPAAAAFGQADVDDAVMHRRRIRRGAMLDCGDLLADDDRQAAVKRPASWIVEQFAAPPEERSRLLNVIHYVRWDASRTGRPPHTRAAPHTPLTRRSFLHSGAPRRHDVRVRREGRSDAALARRRQHRDGVVAGGGVGHLPPPHDARSVDVVPREPRAQPWTRNLQCVPPGRSLVLIVPRRHGDPTLSGRPVGDRRALRRAVGHQDLRRRAAHRRQPRADAPLADERRGRRR